MINAHTISADNTLNQLDVNAQTGLSPARVKASKLKFGANCLTKTKGKPLYVKIIDGLCEPMMIILLVAFTITMAVNIIKTAKGDRFDYVECVGIFCAITLSVAITIIMEGRSKKAFDALNKIGENVLVKTLRGGIICKIPQSELVVGDIIKLSVGDKIPVDARLIFSRDFSVDESPLTGESVPVEKDFSLVLAQNNLPLAERKNMVYGGCFVSAGEASAVVVAVGDSTEIGKIAHALDASEGGLTPLQLKLDKLGKIIALLGGLAAALVFAIQLLTLVLNSAVSFDSVQEIFITSIVLIVASVPEGLPTIVAVSLALNVIKMAKQNALVRKMVACETVGSISIICSDKTGTLTENKMTVTNVFSAKSEELRHDFLDESIQKNICINSTADVNFNDGNYSFIGNPTECAMLVLYQRNCQNKMDYAQIRSKANIVHTYAFSSEHKRMTTVVLEGGKNKVYSKGAPETIIELCELSAEKKSEVLRQIAVFQAQAKRVIAFSHGTTAITDYKNRRKDIEKGLIFDGFVVICDPIRKDVYAAVNRCRQAGVKVKMLTGDNIITAAAIARELKIIYGDEGVYSASQIENMSDKELEKNISKIKVVARSTPMTKLRIVKTLKRLGEVVALTGDGINDAPAIKAADVGIAMGITGTEVSKEAADIILIDDSFSTIVKSIQWGRGIYENFQRFILFQLTVNLSAVMITIICIIMGMESPFNALQLLWINLIMDGPPALSLGLEPIYNKLMDRTPVSKDDGIVTKKMAMRVFANGIFIAFVIILQAITNFLNVWVEKEKTVIFTLFVVFQLFNAFNARELGSESIFTVFARNKVMLVVMLITFALQIAISQLGNLVFNTVPLDFFDWIKVLSLGFCIILFNELYKLSYKTFVQKSKVKTYKSLPN